MINFRLRNLVIGLVFGLNLTACSQVPAVLDQWLADSYYISGTRTDKTRLKDLFGLLAKPGADDEEVFTVTREIASELLRLGDHGKLAHFLTVRVASRQNDPYNAYHLLMVAYLYLREEAPSVAAYYFDRIIKNYPDLIVKGESIHLACLKKLIELVDSPERRVLYYQELISRFPDDIDPGLTYFMLAQAYERIGEWDSAIRTYTKFLPYYETSIPGYPDAFGYARKIVDFYNSPRDWTFENLTDLVNAVKTAMDKSNAANLKKYRAKVNFFAMSWEQEAMDSNTLVEFNFADFLAGNRIRYAENLDASSNANEAFLRTWGWSQRISTWYLYFRKINFPADPEIHGHWEWAGIYFGEKW